MSCLVCTQGGVWGRAVLWRQHSSLLRWRRVTQRVSHSQECNLKNKDNKDEDKRRKGKEEANWWIDFDSRHLSAWTPLAYSFKRVWPNSTVVAQAHGPELTKLGKCTRGFLNMTFTISEHEHVEKPVYGWAVVWVKPNSCLRPCRYPVTLCIHLALMSLWRTVSSRLTTTEFSGEKMRSSKVAFFSGRFKKKKKKS